MIFETLLLATLSVPTHSGTHPRVIAEEYCKDRGGLLQYIDRGSEYGVEFSCVDNPAKVILIRRD